jgi:uncharacterized protein (DUF2141 family)
VQLFRKDDKIPSSPYMRVKSAISNKKAVVVMNNLLYGDYAAIIVHDKNLNGETDHSFGFPSEPLGFTNNWRLTLFSGIPDFDDLKFNFSAIKNQYQIVVED